MSMLSKQCDELREAADMIGAHGVCGDDLADLQTMLREAADAIESLRDRLVGMADANLARSEHVYGTDGHWGHWLTGEEIVRCRDCRHMHTVRHWLGMDVDECWLHADRESGALGKERTDPDGFCAWGERKEDGDGE